MKTLHFALIAFLACLPLHTAIAEAGAGQPAVKHLQVKFEPLSGSVDGYAFQAVEGSVTFPLSHRWGMQIDAMAGDADNPVRDFDISGIGLHVFWRDPSKAMIDFNLSTTQTGIIDYSRFEVLVDYYWSKRTVSVSAGFQFGDIKDAGLGSLQWREYLTDNLTFDFNAAAVDSQVVYGGGFDFNTPLQGLHLFAMSLAGNNGFDATLAGLRLYFGPAQPPNVQRDREFEIQSTLYGAFVDSSNPIAQAQRDSLAPSNDVQETNGELPSDPCDPEQNPFFPQGCDR